MQQMSSANLNNSMAAMMNTRLQQPSPSVLNSQLNQNNSIDDILAQQQNFAKNYNNSTALSKSARFRGRACCRCCLRFVCLIPIRCLTFDLALILL